MKRYLIIFAKEPEKGRVKTRLAGHLSQVERLKLYKQFLKNTLSLVRDIKHCRRIIAYDSDGKTPSFLKKIAPDFEFYRQKGKNLGERIFDAFKAFSAANTETVIIGSDSPGLPGGYINRAFKELNKKDLVLGPAYDGGYYLIGLKKPYRGVFEGIEWSLSSVFDKTLKKAKKLKLKIAVLDFWYDIDTPQDLQYLKKRFCHEV